MNRIYEFAAKTALEDYIDRNTDDCIGYDEVEKATKEFDDYLEHIELADAVKRDLDDKVFFLITKYENCAFINGFCTAVDLAYGGQD